MKPSTLGAGQFVVFFCPLLGLYDLKQLIIIIINTLFRQGSHGLINLWPCSTYNRNWNLQVLVFVEGGKPENPEKNPRSKVRTNNKLNPRDGGYSFERNCVLRRWESETLK